MMFTGILLFWFTVNRPILFPYNQGKHHVTVQMQPESRLTNAHQH